MAGSPPALGIGPDPLATSALCGVPSSCTKFQTLVVPGGTVSVPPPLPKPLKVNGPAMSSKVTVFVAASYLRYCESAAEAAGAAPAAELEGAESDRAESGRPESVEARAGAGWAESLEAGADATGAAPVSGSGVRLEHPQAAPRHAADTATRVRLRSIRNVIRFPRVVRDTRPSM